LVANDNWDNKASMAKTRFTLNLYKYKPRYRQETSNDAWVL